MRKLIALSALIVLNMHSSLVAAVTPNSCYWCVGVGQTWKKDTNDCSLSGNPISTAKECTAALDVDGLDSGIDFTYDATTKYVDKK